MLIKLDDYITDMEANPKVNLIVNCYELFLRWKETQHFTCFCITLNAAHYFMIKIPMKRESY